MCLVAPLKVVSVNKDEVLVDRGGDYEKVMALDDVQEGDYVLVQNGVIVEKVNVNVEGFVRDES
jgi:hydrogenase maturation factor